MAPSLDNLAYTYDGNVAITYNHIDLPLRITFSGTNRFIDFTYNAAGAKVSKKITDGATVTATEYTGGLVYQKINSGMPVLQFFSNEEGYAAANAGVFTYIYHFKDHLDNVRLGYTKNTAGQLVIIEENHYYRFGMKHKGYNAVVNSPGNGIANNFRFNGQEGETKFGLNVTEMDFRQYDAAIGRFTGIDKLSEEFFSMTPYNFAGNNPISYMDPSGLKLITPTDPPYIPGGSVGNLSSIFGNHEHGYLDNLKAMAGGGGGGPGGTGWGFGTGYSNSYQAYQQETSGGYWESSDISGFIDPVTGRMSVELTVTQTWIDTFQQSMDDFMWGVFFPKEKSNFLSISAFTGYAALYLSKTEKLVQLALLGQSLYFII